jgi:uncharacterized protein
VDWNNRFTRTPDGEPGLNYRCPGYKTFFGHVGGPMRLMADLVRQGRFADEIMGIFTAAARNDPCPCGGGLKAKFCHQSNRSSTINTPWGSIAGGSQ